MNPIKKVARLSLNLKLALLAVLAFLFIDEGVLRIMHISFHPSPTLVIISVMANVVLFLIHKTCYLRSQCFILGRHFDELCTELRNKDNALQEETIMRNKYFRKYAALNAQLNVPVKGDCWITKLEELTDNGMDVISAMDNIKQIPEDFVWVKSAPVSPEQYRENFCAAFHASDANCNCDAI